MNKPKANSLIGAYCMVFYAIMAYKWMNGLMLYQLDPAFVYTRQDLATWFLMQAGLAGIFINNTIVCVTADLIFLSLPALLFFLNKRYSKLYIIIAYLMLAYNFCYVQILTSFPSYSIEVLVGWILFPCLFITHKQEVIQIVLHALRYAICYIMLSAAAWKLAQGGLLNATQMSNVLLHQHADILIQQSKNIWSGMYNWLISHATFAQAIYITASLIEAFFVTGFITKRYDRILRYCLVIFIIADFLLMRIAYFDYLVFLLVLPLPEFASGRRKLTPHPAI